MVRLVVSVLLSLMMTPEIISLTDGNDDNDAGGDDDNDDDCDDDPHSPADIQ